MVVGGSLATQARDYGGMSRKLRVGTDVLAMTTPKVKEMQRQSFVAGTGGDIAEDLKARFGSAHSGINREFSFSQNGMQITVSAPGKAVGASSMDKAKGGARQVRVKIGGEETEFTLTGDARITLDAAGRPKVEQGDAILKDGKLQAGDSAGVLIRLSGADVEGGQAQCAVLNLSGQSGNFRGGEGSMTFLGNYNNSIIQGGAGKNSFAGNFSSCNITGGDESDGFAGIFSGCQIAGESGADSFSGIFMGNCSVDGGDGDDTFFGIYNNSALIAGAGKNTFGRKGRLSESAVRAAGDGSGQPDGRQGQGTGGIVNSLNSDVLQGFTQAEQFHSVRIDAGKGDTSMYGVFQAADITLGAGKHSLEGVFHNSHVKNKKGAGAINAYYAESSSFSGEGGQNSLRIRTGKGNVADFGDGTSSITMGTGKGSSNRMQMDGQNWDLEQTEWFMAQSKDEPLPRSGVTDGTLDRNVIDASEGNHHISAHTKDEDHELIAQNSGETPVVLGKKTAAVKTGRNPASERDDETPFLTGPDPDGLNEAVQVRTENGDSLSFRQSNAARKRRRLYYTDYS